MTRDELVALLVGRDAVRAATELPKGSPVRIVSDGDPADWLVDGEDEGTLDRHFEAHASGRATVATIRYGEGVPADTTADRMLALSDLAERTGLLRAVTLVPADGVETPGSWGVEDLTAVVAARRCFSPAVRVRPSWTRIGAQTCGVAVAFGADELVVPAGDRTDVRALVTAAGGVVEES